MTLSVNIITIYIVIDLMNKQLQLRVSLILVSISNNRRENELNQSMVQ